MILRLQRRFLPDYIKKREDFLTLFCDYFLCWYVRRHQMIQINASVDFRYLRHALLRA